MKNIVNQIKIHRLHPDARMPKYEHEGDSGADLFSVIDYVLKPMERYPVPTGLTVEIPKGYEIQVRPKSGLALNHGITLLNTPGTVDSGYRGEIKVILINLGNTDYPIKKGQKIAQMVVMPVIQAEFKEVDELSDSSRGEGGFGSTGLH